MTTVVDANNVFQQIREALVELFELDGDQIHLETHLFDELDLDSIDAVDLVVHLQNLTGKKVKPEEFKSVRTVEDVVNAAISLLKSE